MSYKNIIDLLKQKKSILDQIKDSEGSFYLSIGLKIAENRKAIGLKQEDLADKVGLNRTSITNIELGNQKISVYDLFVICSELNIDIFNKDFFDD